MLGPRSLCVLTLVCLVWLAQGAAGGSGAVRAPQQETHAAYAAGQIVVRARSGAGAAELRAALAARGFSLTRQIPHTRLFSVDTNGRSPAAAVAALAGAPSVAAAAPNYVRHAFDTPNDPYFTSAEAYLETIRAPLAWDLSHGSRSVVIAVVDTGVAPVADLAAQLLPGRNFVAGNADTRDDSTISHGTLVAGIAAATTNNGLGIAGVAWDSSVLPVKALGPQGAGTDFQIAAGVVWAVDHGATVVNLSLGGPSPSPPLCDAVDYATAHGALVVVAAGNTGTAIPMYPAACPGALAVSATDTDGNFAYFSDYGPWIGIAAPGISITSTRNGDTYGAETGTSLAAPMVSGVAALVQALHPDWSPSQVATQLEQTAQDRGPVGLDPYYGYGLLDAYAALGGTAQAPAPPNPDSFEPNDAPTEATALSGSTKATIAPEGDVDWYVVRVRTPGAVAFRVGGLAFDRSVGPNFRAVLQVYDAALNLLATGDYGGFGQDVIAHARVSVPGSYYVRVTNTDAARSPGPYSISVTTLRSPYAGRVLFP